MHPNIFVSAVASCLFSTSVAHMILKSPVPYGKSSLTNGPLAADGSDFPCKQRSGVYDLSTMNSMAVGTPQTLSFTGSAVHGGGSCQVSVSLDEQPTKDSEWKVIHTIIGGCPSNVTGNLPADATGDLAAAFQFSVPSGFPNGKATLAWSWLNKVGNREFYMNCAPIEVTGGSDDKTLYNTLPDMFVANIPATTCGTTENEDFVYPNPGDSVETPFSTALGSKTLGSACQQATQVSGGSGSGSYGGNKPAVVLPTTSTSAAVQTMSSTSIASDIAQSTTLLTTTAALVTTPTTTAPLATMTGYSGNDTASCASGSVSCPVPGSIVCVGSSQFGLCDINYCAIAQNLALGTHCTDGTIAKRSNRHLARHLGHFNSI